MNDCIFCKIIAREIPAEIIYEDEDSLAFLDINPENVGHTLVIPKKHAENIFEIESDAVASLYQSVQRVATAVSNATSANGINVTSNNGAAAGQEIFHYHVHIIPRFENSDSHREKYTYAEGELKKTAEKIRTSF